MDQYTLKLFLHLAESLHFGKTSAACYISPSALSRQIKRLEEEVGKPLFQRDKRSVQLTQAGLLFLEYARGVMEQWRRFQNDLEGKSAKLSGEISIYCSVTACYSILPDLLELFRKQYPDIHIKLQTGDAASAVQQLFEDKADITVAALPDSLPKGLSFIKMAETPLVFIAPRASTPFDKLLARQPLPWDKIPMILSQKGLARKRFDLWFKSLDLHPQIYATVAGNEAILALVSLGGGVGLVPELVVQNSPLKNKVRILPVKHPLQPYQVGICVKERKLFLRQVRAFWDMVEESG